MFAIVAIPRQDDYVWNISSEKIPHMTLLAFEDPGWTPEQLAQVTGYIEHTASFTRKFGLDVDHRGELGEKKADVVFFNKSWDYGNTKQLRSNLLANNDINLAVHADENQFADWIPHLTLGFPSTPAKKDPRDYPGITWVNFDRVALWTGLYDGPTFELKSDDRFLNEVNMTDTDHVSDILAHYGVKGMKWGVRKGKRQTSPDSSDTARVSTLKGSVKTQKTTRHLTNAELEDAIRRMRLEQEFTKLSRGLDKTRAQKAKEFLAKLLIDTGKQTVSQATQTEAKSRVDAAFKKATAAK
jgi:hypothetical protein